MLTLTPIVCVAAALAVSKLLDIYLEPSVEEEIEVKAKDVSVDSPKPRRGSGQVRRASAVPSSTSTGIKTGTFKLIVIAPFTFILILFAWHCTWVTSTSYSSPSVVLASTRQDGSLFIIDDFREAYFWLRQNTAENARVMSWWDYGYQITGMSNRTTIVDNNTWNNTHIASVGKAMSCSEEVSYEVMRQHDVDYVLIIFGSLLGYSGDDINKFLWMIRIGEGVYPNDIKERNFFNDKGQYAVDDSASQTMKDSLMYKMSYYKFTDLYGGGPGQDNVRNVQIPPTQIKLSVVDEVFSTENMLVRIYRVKKPDNIGRPLVAASGFGTKRGGKNYKKNKGKKSKGKKSKK